MLPMFVLVEVVRLCCHDVLCGGRGNDFASEYWQRVLDSHWVHRCMASHRKAIQAISSDCSLGHASAFTATYLTSYAPSSSTVDDRMLHLECHLLYDALVRRFKHIILHCRSFVVYFSSLLY